MTAIKKKCKDKLKIAMVSPYLGESLGGAEVSTTLFADEIVKKQLKVFMLQNKNDRTNKTVQRAALKDDKRSQSAAQYEAKEVKFFNFLTPDWRSFLLNTNLFDVYLCAKLIKLCNKIKPDVIHVQEILMLPAAVKAAEKLHIPIIATVRDNRFICNLATCQSKGSICFNCSNSRYLSCLKKTSEDTLGIKHFAYLLYLFLRLRPKVLVQHLNKCNKVITVSNYIQQNLIKAGVNKNSIQTIYNLIPRWKINKAKVDKLRAEYGKSTFIIFSAGRLVDYKGFQVLIKAMPDIIKSKKAKQTMLLIAGEGPYKNELMKLINKLNLNGPVKLIGAVPFDEIKDYYAMCDVVVVPSLWQEPLSRIIYDSIAANKPLVISDVGGNAEILSKGFTSLYDAQNVKDLSALLLKTKISKPNIKAKQFNRKQVAAYLKVYGSLVQ